MSTRSSGPGPTPITVGPWTILHELNEGGMARVALAERSWGTGEKKVAVLKMPKAEYLLDAKRRKWFFDEAKTALKLDHPNIVPVFDAGMDEGLPYIAMTFVAGRDLAAVILAAKQRSLQIDFELAAYVTLQVAYALQYAHEFEIDGVCQEIVHRDVAAKNVMVSGKGAVQLTDFGVASALSIETTSETVKGTLPYMAPEHALGHATRASDCFGLGTILWSLLEGERMRHDIERPDLLAAAVRGHITPLTRPDVPPQLRAVVDGLLAPKERKRMTLAQVIPILENYPGRRTALSKLMVRLFGRDANRSGHTRMDQPIPEQIRVSKEVARSQHQRESGDGPVTAPASAVAASASPESTVDYGPSYRPGTPSEVHEIEEDAPRVLSFKRRRTSTTNTAIPQVAAGSQIESSAEVVAPPRTPIEAPIDVGPARAQRAPQRGGPLRVLLIGFGSGLLIAVAFAIFHFGLRSEPPAGPDAEPVPESESVAARPVGAAAVEPVAAPAEEKPAEEKPAEEKPAEEEPSHADIEPPPQPSEAPPEPPDPQPATKQANSRAKPGSSSAPSPKGPSGQNVEVSLGLGFVDAADVKLAGKTYTLSRAKPSISVQVPSGSRTLSWRTGGNGWKKRSWQLNEGCRHVAMFEASSPRLSSKCTSPK